MPFKPELNMSLHDASNVCFAQSESESIIFHHDVGAYTRSASKCGIHGKTFLDFASFLDFVGIHGQPFTKTDRKGFSTMIANAVALKTPAKLGSIARLILDRFEVTIVFKPRSFWPMWLLHKQSIAARWPTKRARSCVKDRPINFSMATVVALHDYAARPSNSTIAPLVPNTPHPWCRRAYDQDVEISIIGLLLN